MEITRRGLLTLMTGVLLQPDDQGKRGMVVRSIRPQALETPIDGFADYITPTDRFFVRTHVHVPQVVLADWRLTVDGEVTRPLALTLDDLRQLPSAELVGVLECAGNGRAFHEPSMPGLQWTTGAVGNGRWKGIRLADLLKRAGVKPTATAVLFGGADEPIGTMADFERSIPLAKALDPNTLLAYEMNGRTLPLAHGFPLRAVTPGWAGNSWIKWLTSIRVLDREHEGPWMRSAYRHPGKPVWPGAAVPAEDMSPVTSLRVKSLITFPLEHTIVPPGERVRIRGVAWTGDTGPVTAVEVSVDGGRRWRAAALNPRQQARFGWRQWDFDWLPSGAGYYTILARARDAAGHTQPFEQEWNPSGYLWNVVPRLRVAVGGAPPQPAPPQMRETIGVAPPVFARACGGCHEDDVVRQQRLSRAQWDREINKMVGWGANVSGEDRSSLLEFLSRAYGVRPRVP